MNFAECSLEELIDMRTEIDKLIDQKREANRKEALEEARKLIEAYELSSNELFKKTEPVVKKVRKPVKPVYRNPETGDTWTKRGNEPLWIKDKNREDFLIPEDEL